MAIRIEYAAWMMVGMQRVERAFSKGYLLDCKRTPFV